MTNEVPHSSRIEEEQTAQGLVCVGEQEYDTYNSSTLHLAD